MTAMVTHVCTLVEYHIEPVPVILKTFSADMEGNISKMKILIDHKRIIIICDVVKHIGGD